MRYTPNFKKSYFLILTGCFLVIMAACEDILEEPDISGQEIRLLSPSDSANVTLNTLSFDWEALEDVRGYRIQIATPNFTAPDQLVLDSILERDTLGNTRTRVQWALGNGTYAWRVKGVNGGFETPYTTHALFVNGDMNADLEAPNTPTLVTPADTSAQDETTVEFSWNRESIPGTAEFDSIYIYEDAALTTLNHKGLGANLTYTHTLASGTFYWQVIAFDDAGNTSDQSETFTFTIN